MDDTDHYVEALLSELSAEPDRVVLWWRDRPISAGKLRQSIVTAARVLRTKGVTLDSRVAILITGNSPRVLVARYAANLLGATVLHAQSLNAANSLDAMPVGTQADILAESRTSWLIVDSQNVQRALEIRAQMAVPPALATFGGSGGDLVDLSSEQAAIERHASGQIPACSGQIASVMYTSGSTGRPKGVGYSFATVNAWYLLRTGLAEKRPGIVKELDSRVHPALNAWSPEQPIRLVTTPLGQMIGLAVDHTFGLGGTVVLHDRFEAAHVLATIPKYRVTHLYITPPQLYELVGHPARGATDLSSLRSIVYAGCTAAPQKIAQAVEAFGPIVRQVYGSIEATGITSLLEAEHDNSKLLTTVGRPLSWVQIAIRVPETAEELSVGQSGEICVRAPLMMDGYWCDTTLTAQKLREGWLHTGDVGFLDADGYLHLIDRMAGMIKAGGVKVYPASVEKALLEHPAVAQAAVYGVVDAQHVEHVLAAVVLSRDAALDLDQLRCHVNSLLADVTVPIRISVVDALPLTPAGKPDKRRLREEFEQAGRR